MTVDFTKDEESEEFMEEVYKKELGPNFTTMDTGVAVGVIDFTQDSEYKRLFEGADTCSTDE